MATATPTLDDQTPESLWRAILATIDFDPRETVLEPFRGCGNLWHNLPTGLRRYWCEIKRGVDFFQWSTPVSTIISNPPYTRLPECLDHAFSVATKRVIFLLNINAFNSLTPARLETWANSGWVLSRIQIYNVKKWFGRYYCCTFERGGKSCVEWQTEVWEDSPEELPEPVIACSEASAFLSTLDPESVDLTVTSPPYDGLRIYNGFDFPFESIARELWRITKPGGVVVWVVGDQTIDGSETGTSFRQALFFMGLGFNIHDTMIFRKKNSVPIAHNRYQPEFEFMFVLSKGKPKAFNPLLVPTIYGGRIKNYRERKHTLENTAAKMTGVNICKEEKRRGNVWEYSVGGGNTSSDPEAFEHPAPMPEQLAADHILSWSNPGDLVLDCFLGSGTTAKMARNLGRRFVGCDISAEYVALAQKRLLGAKSSARNAAA